MVTVIVTVIATVILISVNKCRALHPHTLLEAPELIRDRGYPSEVHLLATTDGYILQLHRIPYGRGHVATSCLHGARASSHSHDDAEWKPNCVSGGAQGQRSGRPVILLMHGVLSSSVDFVLNDPHQALAFILADAGYDVWLGNSRGNEYSRRHLYLSPDNDTFWNFSWDEIARFDLPAMLAYIRNLTRTSKLDYVGHSMGTTVFFTMMNYHPHINNWIRKMVALAPSAYIHNAFVGYRLLSILTEVFGVQTNKHETGRLSTEVKLTLAILCSPGSLTSGLCLKIISLVAGPTRYAIEREYLPVIVAHTPAGVATRVLTHYAQLILAQRYQAFDFGPYRNLLEYGSLTPRQYSLDRVTVPVGVFWAEGDWINSPMDVKQIAKELPRVELNYKVPDAKFNHLDFLWSEDARTLVYDRLIAFLQAPYM